MSLYDAQFFAQGEAGAATAASLMLPPVLETTQAKTVVDVGSGTAAWAAVAKAHGCTVRAVDQFVPEHQLDVNVNEFIRCDIRDGYDCSPFDLAICMEVAEHLPLESAAPLVAGLSKARWILWSAAIPGQDGTDHINCQWSSWWAQFFERHGKAGSCDLRQQWWDDTRIPPFYRANAVLWAAPEDLDAIGHQQEILDQDWIAAGLKYYA